MVAIRNGLAEHGPEILRGATIYTSGEPSPMCMGAVAYCRIARVVYGASIEELSRIIGQIRVPSTEIAAKTTLHRDRSHRRRAGRGPFGLLALAEGESNDGFLAASRPYRGSGFCSGQALLAKLYSLRRCGVHVPEVTVSPSLRSDHAHVRFRARAREVMQFICPLPARQQLVYRGRAGGIYVAATHPCIERRP